MDLIEYIERLERLNLTPEEIGNTKYGHLLADRYSSTFSLRVLNPEALDADIPIVSIIKNCDVSSFEVFSISLLDQIEEVGTYSVFGNDEADDLVIHTEEDEVSVILYTVLYEYREGNIEAIEDEYITPVASSQESFLSALYHACDLQSRVIKNELSFEEKDLVARREYADRCTGAAGGERYQQFWYQQLDCLE